MTMAPMAAPSGGTVAPKPSRSGRAGDKLRLVSRHRLHPSLDEPAGDSFPAALQVVVTAPAPKPRPASSPSRPTSPSAATSGKQPLSPGRLTVKPASIPVDLTLRVNAGQSLDIPLGDARDAEVREMTALAKGASRSTDKLDDAYGGTPGTQSDPTLVVAEDKLSAATQWSASVSPTVGDSDAATATVTPVPHVALADSASQTGQSTPSALVGLFVSSASASASPAAGPVSTAAADAPRQVAEVIAHTGGLGMSGAVVVHLNPPNLGRVTLRISASEGHQLRVHLKVERESVREALAADWGQVDTALRAHGLSPDAVSIDVGAFLDSGQMTAGDGGSPGRDADRGPIDHSGGNRDDASMALTSVGSDGDNISRVGPGRSGRLLDYRI